MVGKVLCKLLEFGIFYLEVGEAYDTVDRAYLVGKLATLLSDAALLS